MQHATSLQRETQPVAKQREIYMLSERLRGIMSFISGIVMPRFSYQRYLPKPEELRKQWLLKPVAHLLQNKELWHMNRRAVSGAVFIGLFSAFIPIPSQMVLAAILAIFARCNLPVAVALVWVTNPITIGPMFYFAYKLGAWLLDMQLQTETLDMDISWIIDNFGLIGYPLLFGSLICAWVSGVTGFVITRIAWRAHVIRRWRERRERKRSV